MPRKPLRRAKRGPARGVSSWRDIKGYNAFADLYKAVAQIIPPHETMVEIGNFHGKSLAYLLTLLKDKPDISIFGIDIGVGGPALAHKLTDVKAEERPGITTGALVANLRACKLLDRVTLIVRDSSKAASLFQDESVFFVMVDGDHSYEGVKRDLEAWWPKIKVGGILSGDDYQRYDSVKQAVHDFFQISDAQDPHSVSSWSVRKEAEAYGNQIRFAATLTEKLVPDE